jgi:hypothetical protein
MEQIDYNELNDFEYFSNKAVVKMEYKASMIAQTRFHKLLGGIAPVATGKHLKE